LSADGFNPCAVVETSAGNFQAWLKHSIVFPKLIGTFVAQTLAGRYDADPSAADWRRFGRLPGFTNANPSTARRMVSSLSFGSAATPGSNTPLPRHSSGRSPSSYEPLQVRTQSCKGWVARNPTKGTSVTIAGLVLRNTDGTYQRASPTSQPNSVLETRTLADLSGL